MNRPLLIKHTFRRKPVGWGVRLAWSGECAFCGEKISADHREQAMAVLNVHVAVRHTRLFNLYTHQESK